MKVTINTRTVFVFPTFLAINRFTVGFVHRKLKKEGLTLTKKQILLLAKEFKQYKKSHPDWSLVEIEEKGGDTVTRIKI